MDGGARVVAVPAVGLVLGRARQQADAGLHPLEIGHCLVARAVGTSNLLKIHYVKLRRLLDQFDAFDAEAHFRKSVTGLTTSFDASAG